MPNEILKEVIGAYPEILLEAFNSCLWEGRFFVNWKKQRFVLLRKGNKPLEDESSYRTILLLDTMRKLLEKIILQRLQGRMVGESGLSENQFSFRKGRSTVDDIQAVVDIATKARRGTGKRKGFCTPVAPLKGRGQVHSFGTSCMTISCAGTCLLERESSASRMTHLFSSTIYRK